MKRLLFAVFTVAFASEGAAALRIDVDLSTRLLTAYDGSTALKTYRVSIGETKNPTPEGTFKISKVIWNPSWKPPKDEWAKDKTPKEPGDPDNPMKRVKLFFQDPDYYIHGTDELESLGKARSHGCLRMSPAEVTELAKLVMAHGGKPQPAAWYRRILRLRSSKAIVLSRPVTIQIRG